jgi:ribose 5-phosphate isomerase B
MKLGIAADHGGFELKTEVVCRLRAAGHDVTDFGATQFDTSDDYPDFVLPLARGVGAKQVDRGIAICGSGVGACIAANKILGARAAIAHDHFSAHQGVEDDDMNILCLGARIVGKAYAWELIQAFLSAVFSKAERHQRRVDKVKAIEPPVS